MDLGDTVLVPVYEATLGFDLAQFSMQASVGGEVRTRHLAGLSADQIEACGMTLAALLLARALVLEPEMAEELCSRAESWADEFVRRPDAVFDDWVFETATVMGRAWVRIWPVQPLDPLRQKTRVWKAVLRQGPGGFSLWLELTAFASKAFVPASALLLIDRTLHTLGWKQQVVLALLVTGVCDFWKNSGRPRLAGSFDAAAVAWAWEAMRSTPVEVWKE